jgi:hypothetical protein
MTTTRPRLRVLTALPAAHLLTEVSGRQYGPGALKYHADRGHIPVLRTTTGQRLFRESDVRDLGERLAARSRGTGSK